MNSYLYWFLFVISSLAINAFVGNIVWALIDKTDSHFFGQPRASSMFIQFLVLTLWPVAVVTWWKNRDKA